MLPVDKIESFERSVENSSMGKVWVDVELTSTGDEELLRRGHIQPGQVRHIKLSMLVDTGSTLMSIPEEEIEKLGLPVFKEMTSRFANGQTATRKIYGPVRIQIMGRETSVLTLATHPGMPALLGQIPLEGLDLMVDSNRQRLMPGHPDFPNEQLMEVC